MDDQARHLAQLHAKRQSAYFSGNPDLEAHYRYRIDLIERGQPDPGEPPAEIIRESQRCERSQRDEDARRCGDA